LALYSFKWLFSGIHGRKHVNRVLPTLKEMAEHRLIVGENIVIEQANLG
jgi:hypothetical protein